MGSTNVYSLRPQPPELMLAASDRVALVEAARRIANGVCVLTLQEGERRIGLTASSVSVLSADPATLAVFVSRSSAAYAAFARSLRFAVNVLGCDQRELAEHFALGRDASSADRFDVGQCLALGDGLFCLADCPAVFECETEEAIERQGNTIIVARVRRAQVGGGAGAIVRWRGAYDQLGWSRDEISRAVGIKPGGETQGRC